MQLDEIKTAVKAGKVVYWKSNLYHVTFTTLADGSENWLVQCTGGSAVGLTWLDGVTLNGRPEDFYTADTGRATLRKKLELTGRRWFDRRYGNTYFSASAVLDGETVAHIAFNYGYDDHWLDCICDELEKAAVIDVKREHYSNGMSEAPRHWLARVESETGIAVFQSVTDVKRKKDL